MLRAEKGATGKGVREAGVQRGGTGGCEAARRTKVDRGGRVTGKMEG